MSTALDDLLDVLDLESLEVDIFRGRSRDPHRERVFGGQVAGQALVAAGRTVPPDRPVHSLHAYFLRPGDPKVPIVYLVDRIRDGRSFTTRRVVAVQHGRAIFNLQASFQSEQAGVEHQWPMPEAPPPESLPPFVERFAAYQEFFPQRFDNAQPVDMRYVGEPPGVPPLGEPREPVSKVWLRADGTLPDDPLLHVCVATWASDMVLLDTVLLAHGLAWGRNVKGASLDHAMWFHRPFRFDEWMLYDQWAPSASGSRGLAAGGFFRADGALAISVVQEGLVRTLDS